MSKRKCLLFAITLFSIDSVYALQDLSMEIENKLNSKKTFFFENIETTYHNKMNDSNFGYSYEDLNTYSYKYKPSLGKNNYSLEEITTEAIFLLSNHIFDRILPSDWSINLKYFVSDENKIIEQEEFFIEFEKKIKL